MVQTNNNNTIKADNKSLPMISVVMPAYNAEKYIKQAIESVQKQTFGNWELYVVDDCSGDGTREIVKELQSKDSRIQLICNKENLGVSKTRNKGFEVCKGDYVALLDSDDIWYPEKLEKQLDVFENTGAEIVYCSYSIIDEKGQQICSDFIVPEDVDFELMLVKSVISCSTAMFRKSVIEKYHFSEKFYHEDYVLWLTMLSEGRVARGTCEVLAGYRQIEESRAANKFMCAIYRWKIYREYLKLPLYKSIKCFVEYSMSGLKKYSKLNKMRFQ